LLLSALSFPEDWPVVANQFAYTAIVAILTAGRAHGFTDPYVLPENPVEPFPQNSSGLPPSSNSIEAIAGADGAASNGVPLKEVFDVIVATTRDITPTCMFLIFVTLEHLWIDQGLQLVPCGPDCMWLFLPCIFADMDGQYQGNDSQVAGSFRRSLADFQA